MGKRKVQYNEGLAATWDALEYLAHDIPKSLDNNWIREEYLPIISDLKVDPKDALKHRMQSHCDSDQKKISKKFSIVLPEKIMITGGGTHNTYLISCIEKQLSTIGIQIFIPEKNCY